MVVAVTVSSHFSWSEDPNNHNHQEMQTSKKAIKEMCQATDYRDNCVKSISSVAKNHTTDPKELVKLAFEVTINEVRKAFKESEILKNATKDPRTSKALESCKELMNYAIEDLKSSVAHFDRFDKMDIERLIEDIKVWLSASMTYQETCLDGFEGAEGDTAAKMRKAIQGGSEMASNALAIVNEISSLISSLDLSFFSHRRLLSEEEFPEWVSDGNRRLLTTKTINLKPDVVVAKDGSGNFSTIKAALRKVPKKSNTTFVIYIKEGVYKEHVFVEKSMQNVVMIGDGADKTKITGKKNFIDGTPTFKTATVAVVGEGFLAKNIGFENTAGPEKHQAVALRVQSDRAVFYKCQMDGYQDTLYVHTHRQFFRECTITGTIDFIFGNAAVVLQNCKILVRKPMDNQQNIVTAHGRKDRREPTAIIIHNCTISADPTYYPLRDKLRSYLGRPWKEYSRTFIFQSQIDDLIQPEGWLPWNGDFALNTCFYSEFENRGAGSSLAKRVKWRGVKNMTVERAHKFTVEQFIRGSPWIIKSGVPFTPGLLPLKNL